MPSGSTRGIMLPQESRARWRFEESHLTLVIGLAPRPPRASKLWLAWMRPVRQRLDKRRAVARRKLSIGAVDSCWVTPPRRATRARGGGNKWLGLALKQSGREARHFSS